MLQLARRGISLDWVHTVECDWGHTNTNGTKREGREGGRGREVGRKGERGREGGRERERERERESTACEVTKVKFTIISVMMNSRNKQ